MNTLLSGTLTSYTPRTITDAGRLKAQLNIIRARGYAIDDEEIVLGTRCAGAAIFESAGMPVTLHSGGELAISQAAYVHLAASIPNLSIAIDTERAYLGGDISREPIPLRDGRYEVSDAPGLGVTVDEDLVERYRVDSIVGAYLDPANPGWFPLKPAY